MGAVGAIGPDRTLVSLDELPVPPVVSGAFDVGAISCPGSPDTPGGAGSVGDNGITDGAR